jgi:hypothetical protein
MFLLGKQNHNITDKRPRDACVIHCSIDPGCHGIANVINYSLKDILLQYMLEEKGLAWGPFAWHSALFLP